MSFYTGNMSVFKAHPLVWSLKFRALYLDTLNIHLPVAETVILKDKIGRIRDIAIAPDGAILLLTDEVDGGLYRLAKP